LQEERPALSSRGRRRRGFGDGTYAAFLWKHRKGNPGGNSELFRLIAPGAFGMIRPFPYDV